MNVADLATVTVTAAGPNPTAAEVDTALATIVAKINAILGVTTLTC